LRSGKDRRREHRELVHIELRGLELQLEPSRLAVERIDIDEPAAELLAVDLRLEPIDGDPVGTEREFAAGAQQPGRTVRRAGAAFQPGQPPPGVARLGTGRTMQTPPLARETEP